MRLSKLLPLKEALNKVSKLQVQTEKEEIPLEKAYKRVLGEDIYSYHDSPPFDKSAMDGFAVIAENTFGASQRNPKQFKVIDEIGAGSFSDKIVKKDEAILIATGSPIPEGANAVIMKEYTSLEGNNLEIQSQVTPSENISITAEDIQKGDKILSSNTLIRPQELGLIASAGYDKVKVYKKPIVKLIITGNELVEPTKTLDKAKIINSNQFILASMIKSTGAIAEVIHIKDDYETLKAAFSDTEGYDVLISTGGTALSKGDLVVDVTEEIGEMIFHGAAIRPGKPAGFGKINNTPIFMLSGQPVAAMAQFDIFARKYLINLQGRNYDHKLVKRTSKVKIHSTLGRTDYVRAVSDDEFVRHVLNRGSGIIRSMVEANSFIIIDENNEGIDKGDLVDVILFNSME